MPTFLLCIKAELENVGSLSIKTSATHTLDVQESGGSEVRKGIEVNNHEEVELSGSKGTAHFAMKFAKGSKSEASISIVDLKGVTRAYTAEDAEKGKFVPIVAFECRGLEPIGYAPGFDWVVEAANSSSKWDDVDLSLKEWNEYDEKAGESVGIYNFEAKFQLHK